MQFTDINPFIRHVGLQPSAISCAPLGRARDHRIFYVLQGTADLVLKDKRVTVSAGTLLYLPSATAYYFDGKIKVIVINFDLTQWFSHLKKTFAISKNSDTFDYNDVLEKDLPQELSRMVILKHATELEPTFFDCLQYRHPATAYADAMLSANVKRILCHLLPKQNEPSQPVPRLVKEILLYIQQNYDNGITNERIADAFGYHSFYLNRIFKKATGYTLHQAVVAQQIEVAKNLLKSTDFTVKAICCEVGISDSALFCTTFKKQTGVTPMEYRKAHSKVN